MARNRNVLKESLGRDSDIVKSYCESFIRKMKETPFAQEDPFFLLGVWVGSLRALGMIHHLHHWQTSGSTFYADHLLLERLYTAAQEEIDSLGEKATSFCSPLSLTYENQLLFMKFFHDMLSGDQEMMFESFKAEVLFVCMGELILKELKSRNVITAGIENMFEDVLDKHETHIYLLKQRVKSPLPIEVV